MSIVFTMLSPATFTPDSRHDPATIIHFRTSPDPAISLPLKLPNFIPLYLAIAAGRKH